MDRIAKFHKKISTKEGHHIEKALTLYFSGRADELDIKKLKGVEDVYRIRIGNIRIIFLKKPDDIEILDISRRSDTTYRDF